MTLQIDSREHKSELARICKQLDRLGVKYFISKLPCGDYMDLDNARLVVDRKKDLQEICGNVCQEHERFRAEMIRAQEHGIHIIFLCEHGEEIKDLEDVIFWENPRRVQRVKKDGKWQTIETKAMNGDTLYKILKTMERKYNVEFYFCTKEETGGRIVELLQDKRRNQTGNTDA